MLRRLRNLYGDSVLEIIPQGIREAVDAVHAFGKVNPDVFQTTPFDNAKDRNDCELSMRAYCEMAGEKGYTLYVKPVEEDNILVWKVTDRRTRNTRGE